VDDPLEREADAVADHVMRMPDPPAGVSQNAPVLSRKCSAREAASTVDKNAAPVVERAVAAGGQGLDINTRGFMESRFARNFGDVRIHTDARAAESAQAVGARAFTVGRDVLFAPGEYQPQRDAGRRLFAHELVHTIQQSGGGAFVQREIPQNQGLGPSTSTPVQPMGNPAPPPARPDSGAFFSAYKDIGYSRWQGEGQRHEVWKFVGGAIGKSFDGRCRRRRLDHRRRKSDLSADPDERAMRSVRRAAPRRGDQGCRL